MNDTNDRNDPSELPELYGALRACAAETVRVLRGIDPAALDAPTPSAEWDLRAVVNHLVLWTAHNFALRAEGGSVPAEWYERDFTADPGWAEAYAQQVDKALAAWSDPSVWEREMPMGDSAVPAAAIAGMILLEFALHGWEAAQGSGQTYTLDDATATAVLGQVEQWAQMFREYSGFADPIAVPADAPPFTRALALSGRAPR
ncbi:TIGR03086 family metal-binding protein [Streptacidiphilus melanogenes]|uniref:TIGR03086 family metal-binding protein n=1 Tax=Streptacidiphilus melanogenes TaxID=411235 RepID=UPI0005A7F1C9|nr:TIGR03086 family metal-binding protein [Streptacidiphilus melanogenes]